MAKTSKKALGAAMAGVMAVGAVAGAVNAVDQVKVANAAESSALTAAKAKISHLSWSVKNNYLGIKNQGQWEAYIKEARALIAQMPAAESLQAQGLTSEVDKIAALVQAVARVNQVEKSMETNFKGIKNAKTWRGYLELAKVDMVKVDAVKFADQLANITERLNKSSDEVKKIEDAFKVDYDKVVADFNKVKDSKNLDDAKKVLAAAEALGTCEESDKLESDIKAFIAEIDKSQYVMNSVEAINERKVEIKFNKEVEDAKAIAKDGDRIVIVKAGDSINDEDADKIVSNIITFSSDNKTATAVLDTDLEAGVKYTVHLVSTDGKESVASKTDVLVEKASNPGTSVSDGSDKVIVKFKEKMDDAAIETSNYKVFDSNGNEVSDPFVDEKTEWVDRVEKKEVKFTVAPGALKAGEDYKIEVDADAVKTDKGDKLTSSQKIIKFKTPSVESSRPEITNVYAQDDSTLVVKFSKKLQDKDASKDLITLKRADGKIINIDDAEINGSDKELVISVPADTFEDGEGYKLTLQANTVINNVYRNAGNAAVSSHSVSVPDAKAVTSVKAKFVSQSDKKKFDLKLSFDKSVKDLDTSKVKIEKSGETYSLSSLDAKIDSDDSSNKTIVIEDVQDVLSVKADATYKIIIEKGAVSTASIADVTNKEELKDTIDGINSAAPSIDKITLESASKMTVKFNRSINIDGLTTSDVKVQGFIKKIDDSVEKATLTGSKQIKLSASGDTLTITAANDNVKFATSDVSGLLEIAEETIKDTNGIVDEVGYTEEDAKDIVDNAAPEMIGAEVASDDSLDVIYTEEVELKNSSEKAANQFSVTGVEKDREATDHSGEGSDVLTLTFDSNTFKTDKDYSDAKVKYTKNTNYYVKDAEGNIAASATITGISNENSYNPGGDTTKAEAKKDANDAIAKLADYTAAGKVTEANKADVQKLVDAANAAVKTYVDEFEGSTADLTDYANIATVQAAIDALAPVENTLKGIFGNILGADYVEVTMPAGKTVTSVKVDGTETAKSNYNLEEGVLTILKVKDTNKIEVTTNDNVVYTIVK